MKYDLTSKRFERLLVLDFGHIKSGRVGLFWRCVCDCGETVLVRSGDLRNGVTKSCGCLFREKLIARNTKHGLCNSHKRAYNAWVSAIARCSDLENKLYGGRGITVCIRWRKSFVAFLEDMGDPPSGMTLDRCKTSKGYSKSNCRWATPRDNSNNRRNTRFLRFNRELKPLSVWAEQFEIDLATLDGRLRRGWSARKALETPADIRFNSRRTPHEYDERDF